MPRTGRPKSDNPKNINLNIRLTKTDADRLQKYADTLRTSRTDVILRGLNLVEVELNKQIEQAQP